MSKQTELEQAILDCWKLLKPKVTHQKIWLSQRLRNEEILENQEELINQLKEILEPAVERIKKGGDE